MDLAMIRNVSAAALRAKGRAYPVPGAREPERQLMLRLAVTDINITEKW